MAWNPAVLSGIGVVDDVRQLYADVHSYLAASGARAPLAQGLPVWPCIHAGGQHHTVLEAFRAPIMHKSSLLTPAIVPA
jgi:hypothetical protein